MDSENKTVNVEEIMAQIRSDIREEKGTSADLEQVMEEIEEEARALPHEEIPSFDSIPIENGARATAAPAAGMTDDTIGNLVIETDYLRGTAYNPYYWDMGKGIRGFIKRIVRRANKCLVYPMNEHQNDFNLHVVNGLEYARQTVNNQRDQIILDEQRTQQLHEQHEQQIQQLHEQHEQQIQQLHEQHEQQIQQLYEQHEQQIQQVQEQIQQLYEQHEQQIQQVQEQIQQLQDQLALTREQFGQYRSGTETALQQLAAKNQAQDAKMHALDKAADEIAVSVAGTIRYYLAQGSKPAEASAAVEIPSPAEAPETEKPAKEESVYTELDYFKFQNDFRGTQSEIMDRQRQYIEYFTGKKGKVFDLGCGRGEFLRLMKEAGISAYGAETFADYEIIGKMYGIDIRIGDGLEMLEQTTEPLGGIFCAQVIEHMDFPSVERLCRLALEKLEDGAYLILESPNTMCLSTLSNAFYLDPTHNKPVHPLLIEYLVKNIGFSEVQILWPDHTLEPLPAIQSDSIRNLDEVNRAIARVSNLLYGSQDYAIVAKK